MRPPSSSLIVHPSKEYLAAADRTRILRVHRNIKCGFTLTANDTSLARCSASCPRFARDPPLSKRWSVLCDGSRRPCFGRTSAACHFNFHSQSGLWLMNQDPVPGVGPGPHCQLLFCLKQLLIENNHPRRAVKNFPHETTQIAAPFVPRSGCFELCDG